jgi:hypothetical protein
VLTAITVPVCNNNQLTFLIAKLPSKRLNRGLNLHSGYFNLPYGRRKSIFDRNTVLMILHRFRFVLPLLLLSQMMIAQNEEKAVKAAINRFFEGMEKGDTALLKKSCTDDPVLQSYMADKEGKMMIYSEDFADLMQFIGTPSKDKYKEEIEFDAIHVEKSLASVWTPYIFYVNGKISHCGTNSFQLVKTSEGWKIQYIIDTRRKQGCK